MPLFNGAFAGFPLPWLVPIRDSYSLGIILRLSLRPWVAIRARIAHRPSTRLNLLYSRHTAIFYPK